jgi:hypothetical protein
VIDVDDEESAVAGLYGLRGRAAGNVKGVPGVAGPGEGGDGFGGESVAGRLAVPVEAERSARRSAISEPRV